MDSKREKRIGVWMAVAAVRADEWRLRLRETPEAKIFRKQQETFAKMIYETIDSAVSIEELITVEMALQELDNRQARTKQDQTAIKNAQRDYLQLAACVEQMRTSPENYLLANKSLRETGGDLKKLPRSRGLQQIGGNRTRMQNRAAFAHEDEIVIWEARIALTDKTESLLKALHKDIVAAYPEHA